MRRNPNHFLTRLEWPYTTLATTGLGSSLLDLHNGPLRLAVDAEHTLSISSALGDAVQVLRTADERFADRDGFPFLIRAFPAPHRDCRGGHFVQEDRPTEVANLLLNFIEA